jgi:hypothetical protein
MKLKHHRSLAAVLCVLAAAPITLGLIAIVQSPASAQDTTTTAPPPTTTTSPPTTEPTTTTVPPTTAPTTTTTTHPTTTTSRARPTTTTSHPTTTTTTTAAKSTSSSKTWGWVLLAVVIVLAILLVAFLIARTRRQGQAADWRRTVRPVVTAAELARDLVLSQTESDSQQRRSDVAVQVDEAVESLERAAASAPDDMSRGLCTRCAESLRGLAFAIEADHLMRSGGQHPTGDQLASADAARRHRSAELDEALLDLKAAVAEDK